MVSGFLTSPYDHERIMSGEASPILIRSKSSTALCCLNSLSKSFMKHHLLPICSSRNSCETDSLSCCRCGSVRRVELDVDRQRTNLLDQHVERLGHAGLHLVRAVDDVLVHLRPALHVVRLDRQHLLQGVGSAVSLERPDLHLA